MDHPETPPLRVTRGLRDEILTVVNARRQLFGLAEADARDPFRIGPYSGLLGRSLRDFELFSLDDSWSAEQIAQDSAGQSTARLVFSFGRREFAQPVAFAVAVDDMVVATTAAFPGGGSSLSVMVPVAPPAADRLRLLRIDVDEASPPRLGEVSLSRTTYRLSSDGAWILGGDGERWKIEQHVFRGEVQSLAIPSPRGLSRILAWAVDDQDRPPERLVVFSGARSLAWASAGVPRGDFLDYLKFNMPEERVFFLAFHATGMELRYFVLGTDGRAGELPTS